MMKPMYNKESFLEEYKERKAEYKARKLNEEVQPDQGMVDKTVSVSIIGGLIKTYWSLIDEINSDIIQLNIAGADDMVPVLNDMISDAYMNIGQLEKLLEGPAPESVSIDDGREAVDDIPASEDEEELTIPDSDEESEEDYPDDVIIK